MQQHAANILPADPPPPDPGICQTFAEHGQVPYYGIKFPPILYVSNLVFVF